MASESIHEKLNRVRKPRVHIKFDVEKGDAEPLNELPFVVGVMGDFSGMPSKPLKPLKERKFIQIDRDNFNDVLQKMTPEVKFRVTNTIANDNTEMPVELKFDSIESFEPAQVAQQVPALRKLLEQRDKLRDLLTKIDRSDKLESLLDQVMKNPDDLNRLAKELGVDPAENK